MKKFESSKRLMWFFALLLPAVMAGCADSNGGVITQLTPPTVTLTAPARAAAGVPVNRSITATFSKGMNLATINSKTTFTLRAFNTSTPIAGSITLDATSNIATLNPTDDLKPNTAYLATITTGVKDLAGISLAKDYFWSFETAATSDTTAPTVIYTGARNGATGLSINRSSTATFSEAMDSATLASPENSFTLKRNDTGASVPGKVTYIGNTAIFKPNTNLAAGTNHTSTITSVAKDLAGNALVEYIWSWTTAPAGASTLMDNIAPTVTLTNPANEVENVAVNRTISASFSEPMDPATIITTNFTVTEKLDTNIKIDGTVYYDAQQNIATFTPESNLEFGTEYRVTVTNGATDLAGNQLLVPAVPGATPNWWTFKTVVEPLIPVAPQPLAINLRGASTFGIASRASLTSTGVTVVNGDIALYPLATCTDSTGGPGEASQDCLDKTYASATGMTVNGSIYWAGDPFDNGGTANSITNDLNIAWKEAMNKADTNGAVLADELGGKTFTPGVYHNANLGLKIGGVATMDAGNDPNAVFIFKVDSTFVDSGTLLKPSEIKLINGAQARNIWFVTGIDLTIGSGTTWYGNILAGGTAKILDGSNVMGRVLAGAAGAGAVTLTGAASPSVTTITVPE